MLIHRSRTDGAPPRKRHLRLAVTSQQRPEHHERRAHGFDQLVGCAKLVKPGSLNLHPHFFVHHDIGTHGAQQPDHGGYVAQMGHGAKPDGLAGKQGSGQDRQRCVFRTRYVHSAAQPAAAADE